MKLFSKKSDNFGLALSKIFFRVFSVIFVVLFLLEFWQPGFVTMWFNPVWLLILAIISGIILTINN